MDLRWCAQQPKTGGKVLLSAHRRRFLADADTGPTGKRQTYGSCSENTKARGKKHEHECKDSAASEAKENNEFFCGKKAPAMQTGVKPVSETTVSRQNVSEPNEKKYTEWSTQKSDSKQEYAIPKQETEEVQQKSAQELEAERQQKLENLRAAMQKQICAIHANVELPAGGQNSGETVEQKLHLLLYKAALPESDLNQVLGELRTERRRQKAEYQGAPFADVFLVNLILSDEDSERACIVDVGDTGMSYVIPWSSIPEELRKPLHRYVSEAEGKLCGYCEEELCNSESGRMIVELYLGKQDGHGSRILY